MKLLFDRFFKTASSAKLLVCYDRIGVMISGFDVEVLATDAWESKFWGFKSQAKPPVLTTRPKANKFKFSSKTPKKPESNGGSRYQIDPSLCKFY